MDIGKTLNDDTLSDDQKVKRYLQTLNRYYQVTDTVPTTSTVKSNPLTVVVAAKTKKKKRLGRRIRMSYVVPKASGSFGGIQNVRRYGGEVKDLARNDAYTLHKSARVRFRRRKTYSKGPGNLFQIDLADLRIMMAIVTYSRASTSLRNEHGPSR